MPETTALTTRAAGTVRQMPRKPRPQASLGFLSALPSTAGVSVGPNTALTYSAVYRAVTLISSTVGSLPLHLFKHTVQNGRPARELVSLHQVSPLASRGPNPETRPLTWKEYIGRSLCMWGNYYGYIWRRGDGRAHEVWNLPPDRMRVDRDDTGELVYFYSDGQGYERPYSASEILHIKLFGDGMVGKSPIGLSREAIGLGIASEQFGAAFYGNSAIPSGIITHPETFDAEAKAAFIRNVESRHMGPGQAWRLMVSPPEYKYQNMGVPPKDAQYIELRVHQIQEVARIFGIPAHMLAENTRSTFNNITMQSMEFFRDTIRHYLVRIEEELNHSLLGPQDADHFFRFELKGLLRADPKTESEMLWKYFQMGVMSPNEISTVLDRNPIGPEGETRFVPGNMVTLENAINPPKPKPAPALPAPDLDQGTGEDDEADDDQPDELKAAFRVLFRDAVGRLVHRELTALGDMLDRFKEVDDVDQAIREWCHKHEDVVVGILRPTWDVCSRLAGVDIVEEVEGSRHVEELRRDALDVLRSEGVCGLRRTVEQWRDVRADTLLGQYVELAGLNGRRDDGRSDPEISPRCVGKGA